MYGNMCLPWNDGDSGLQAQVGSHGGQQLRAGRPVAEVRQIDEGSSFECNPLWRREAWRILEL